MAALHNTLMNLPQVPTVIISVALMLFSGFLLTRITKRLRLPNVTAYILAGILIGPYCLDLVPQRIIDGTDFLSDIALAFIAFSTGEFFKLSVLKRNGMKVVWITVCEAVLASVAVFVLTYWILRLELAFSIVLAALASATAPASTMMTIRQTGAHGDFVDTLLQVVALDDVVGLVLYSIAISVALASLDGTGFTLSALLRPVTLNILIMALGGMFGLFMKLLMPSNRSTDNKLIISIALLFSFCGICALLDISPLLGCMAMGTVYTNIAENDKLFKQLGYFSPPILLLFFVRSGMSFRLDALVSASGAMNGVPLLVIGGTYFLVRILGKYLGAWLGCRMVKKGRLVRNYLGLALIPQAGVAIGLAALGARTLGGTMGEDLQTIILASSVLYELIGPGCAKLALYLSRSYSTRLEDLAPVEPVTEAGQPKNDVQLLIERIQKIQKSLPEHEPAVSEEEAAFTEAAEEHFAHSQLQRRYFSMRR
ncbi:cation:proton antiporter [Pseudoflavonifractor sp. MSJ-30]|uniref:cation:proton antiporter n=1 Tax=Pseudoflavonifractor sp. MSJ-30 TaxID=2841525 RepID=UPI0035302BB1